MIQQHIPGIERVTENNILSKKNQYYIGNYFLYHDILHMLKTYAKGVLIDIGCGNKPYASIIKGLTDSHIGCDIVQSSANNADFLCPADNLCFEEGQFDTVFCTQVLEHVADHRKVVSESFRVLKRGGHAIFSMPFSWELHEEPYDFFRFSKYGLIVLFEQAGFEIIEIKANGGKWAAVFQLFLNTLYSTRRYNTFRSRIIKLIFVHLKVEILYNNFAVWLDKKYTDDLFTLNYVVVAKK
ncbi:class I SAM-dependent methyltransferase [Parasediminibacterium sp. JCM 36343]|uniref:class I SAM-dependent methyltransferase n=1 Tax=Parasediminibacterium sp. JCM 36343 TaxID=3374279 RepID=UPI00397D158D